MKNKNKFFAIGLILLNAVLSLFLLGNVVYHAVSSAYVVKDAGMFTETVTYGEQQHTWYCYQIAGSGNETKIAIAWGEPATAATGTIKVPNVVNSSKPTGTSVPYSVVAVANGGFSRCTMTGIELPQSITEIKEGAFSYCHSLTTIQLPKDITEIAASTFLDCRALTSVYYSDETGKKTLSGGKITTIGDHAFDSCVSLVKIQCPSAATLFKKSCFQNCVRLNEFRFPYDNGKSGDARNEITVEEYAFHGCKDLHTVYFDVNMKSIAPYAFADSFSTLVFRYCGIHIDSSDPTVARADDTDFDNANPNWRNKYLNLASAYSSELYSFLPNEKPVALSEYPGLYYYLTNDEQLLDNARHDETGNETSVKIIEPGGDKYAVIDHFEIPEMDQAYEDAWGETYYYEDSEGDGILHLPDYIQIGEDKFYIKVIRPNAFSVENYDLENLKEIYLNENLVQIQNHAFYHSNQIRKLDFSACTHLREVSYALFNEIEVKGNISKNDITSQAKQNDDNKTNQYYNSVMKSITLPNCLEYIGNFAFYNFTDLYLGINLKKTDNQISKLKIIGDYAFACNRYLGDSPTSISVDLLLPNSLDDGAAPGANIYHTFAWDKTGNGSGTTYPTVHQSIENRYAVNDNAFENQRVIKTVTMEDAYRFHEDDEDYVPHTTSFAASAFVRCPNLLRFQSNQSLWLLGTNCFKQENTGALRELFLDATKAIEKINTIQHPWGINDKNDGYNESIVQNTQMKELIIYVKSSTGNAPNPSDGWNKESKATYVSAFDNSNRGTITVYYVDWYETGNVKYWHINTTTDELISMNKDFDLNNGPKTVTQYNDGYIAFVNNNTTSNPKYTVTRYYTDGASAHLPTRSIVNLTASTVSGLTITKIGDIAFAGCDSKAIDNKGLYYILPKSVITIGNRAFYRGRKNEGVRIVTFKQDDGKIRKHGEDVNLTDFDKDSYINSVTDSANGYCCLSANVETIDKNAFYNNRFCTVDLGASLTYFGVASFYAGTNGLNKAFAFDLYGGTDANPYYTTVDGAVYYTFKANQKTLIHFPNGKNTDISIDAGTKSIGFKAATNCKLKSVTFNNDGNLTTIYGYAFAGCSNLETLTNVSSLQFISAFSKPDTEVLSGQAKDGSKVLFDNSNSGNNRGGAFENCTKLNLKNFDNFSAIKKIGYKAFSGCNKLTDSLDITYDIYTYTEANGYGSVDTKDSGVLDLSRVSTLTTLEREAFNNCGISHAILPNTAGDYSSESKFYYGYDYNQNTSKGQVFTSASTKVLCGETAIQADQLGTSSLKPTTHYPTSAYSLDKFYFRVKSSADLLTNSAAMSTRKYWTTISTDDEDKIVIIMFENKADADHWFANQTADVAKQNDTPHIKVVTPEP